MDHDSSDDEDVKVLKKIERREKLENDPIGLKSGILEKTGLSLAELNELQEIFQLVDLDHSGAISRDELLSLMTTLGLRTNQMELDNMILEADPENTGGFVLQVSKKLETEYTYKDLENAFKRFLPQNEINDGKLPMKTLIDILTQYGDPKKRLSTDEAIDLINQVSSEKKSEYFDYIQFCSVYFK